MNNALNTIIFVWITLFAGLQIHKEIHHDKPVPIFINEKAAQAIDCLVERNAYCERSDVNEDGTPYYDCELIK